MYCRSIRNLKLHELYRISDAHRSLRMITRFGSKGKMNHYSILPQSPFMTTIARSNSQSSDSIQKQKRPKLIRKDDENEEYKEVYDFFYGFLSAAFLVLGLTFCFVPLYKLYCSSTGVGFDSKFVSRQDDLEDEEEDDLIDNKGEEAARQPKKNQTKRIVTVNFNGQAGAGMPIAFIPLQKKIDTLVGEPCLAFYAAYNKTDQVLHGISTYNITPGESMSYLNKIQCFCFEEQRFKPHELVEMPVFFYFQKEMLDDPLLSNVQEMILSYTFFNLQRNNEIVRNF